MTIRQYLHSNLTAGTAKITALFPGESPMLRTLETWFHPKGGGQKADEGSIGQARVLQVLGNMEEVDHVVDSLEGLVEGREYPFEIDREARLLNSAYHTAGHLLANLLERQYPALRATKGHHWPGEARVVFEGELGDGIDIVSLNSTLASVLAKGLPVQIVGDPFSSRAIQIGDFQPIPCGGVHIESLDQIQSITVTHLKQGKHPLVVHYETCPCLNTKYLNLNDTRFPS